MIIVKLRFDALPPLLLLFKHEPFLSSQLFFPTTKPQFDMQVLRRLSFLHTKLFWIAAGDLHLCHPAAISSPLTLFMCVCGWERVRESVCEKVEAADENHRATSDHNNNTVTNITWYQLWPQLNWSTGGTCFLNRAKLTKLFMFFFFLFRSNW